jgi:hypothetical protein
MATEPHNIRRHAWNTAYSLYLNLIQHLDQAPPADRDRREQLVAEHQGILLELPAPNLAAVLQKLKMIWELDLEKPDQDGDEKRLIIGDIGDLIVEGGQLLGITLDPRLFAQTRT